MINPNQLGRRPFPAGASQWMLVGLRGTPPPPSGLADGDPVTTWADSSGNGHTATQSGTARPTFKTNILNGKPAVRFASASSQCMSLASPFLAPEPSFCFVVMKGTPVMASIGGTAASLFPFGPFEYSDGNIYAGDNVGFIQQSGDYRAAFHVVTARQEVGLSSFYIDGTGIGVASGTPAANSDVFNAIGRRGSIFSDGDIAEIIYYTGTLALRVKLVALLTLLLTTGEFPSEAELELMIGNRARIRHYLHQHGAHPTNAQLDAVVTPFAPGDRANVEKYLGTKYGITVAGGTAADPSTVAGLVGWWKADSLL